jgi:Tn3 transposase DDE domain-containing protein
VFHGKQGELRQRYREGQEDQLGALGLVVNMIVLWNTVYINAALEQLAREGHHLKSEDVARISPLIFEHINLLGRYAFSVPEAVSRGELRPLRNPTKSSKRLLENCLNRFSAPLLPNTHTPDGKPFRAGLAVGRSIFGRDLLVLREDE